MMTVVDASVWGKLKTHVQDKNGELTFNGEEFANKIAKYYQIMRLLEGDIRYLKKV